MIDITTISAVNENSISVPNDPTIYTKEYIDAQVIAWQANVDQDTATLQNWLDLQSSPTVTALKTQAEIAQAAIDSQPLSATPQ